MANTRYGALLAANQIRKRQKSYGQDDRGKNGTTGRFANVSRRPVSLEMRGTSTRNGALQSSSIRRGRNVTSIRRKRFGNFGYSGSRD